MIVGPHSTKLPQSWDTGLINPAYLLLQVQFSSWDVANPRTTLPNMLFADFDFILDNFCSFDI